MVKIKKVLKYRSARVAGNKRKLPRTLFEDVWAAIPAGLRANHIVVKAQIEGEEFALHFSDRHVIVGDKIIEGKW